MATRRSERIVITRVDGGVTRRQPDELIVEEPMSIQLDGTLVSTTMRTPGNDFELAVGYCYTDGLLAGAAVHGVRYCATGSAVDTAFNVVTVETGNRAPVPTPRLTTTSSSCGLCGSASLDELAARLFPLPVGRLALPSLDAIASIANAVVGTQGLFKQTGSVHAAAAFRQDGTVVLTREDVGRHNAVDKVVGRLLLDDQLPAHQLSLFVSGRASFEIVQKAWAAGFAAVVAVSAPTSLAVHTARRAGMLLAGFVRGDRFNVYSPERLANSAGHLGLASV
jgi:FdhD protein